LVNNKDALDFTELTKHGVENGRQQALNIPDNTGPLSNMLARQLALDTTRKAPPSRSPGTYAPKWPKLISTRWVSGAQEIPLMKTMRTA